METESCTFQVHPGGPKIPGVRWKNPDGRIGGWVAQDAIVHPTAIIRSGGMVLPGVTIGENDIVEDGEVVAQTYRLNLRSL